MFGRKTETHRSFEDYGFTQTEFAEWRRDPGAYQDREVARRIMKLIDDEEAARAAKRTAAEERWRTFWSGVSVVIGIVAVVLLTTAYVTASNIHPSLSTRSSLIEAGGLCLFAALVGWAVTRK